MTSAVSMSSLRKIAPLKDTQGRVVPGGLIEPRPTFCSVAPTSLLVDETYQRSLSERSERMIREIVRDWSWASYKAPVCVETANDLVIIDGQHTAIAAATRGIGFIPVLVVAADSIEEQAKAFLGQNTRRLNVTKMQIFQAAVAAGDEDACTAKQVCERASVKILMSPRDVYSARETLAVTAVVSLAKRQGAMVARQIIEAVADAGVEPIKAIHLRAAELVMRDHSYASDRMSYPELTATIAHHRNREDFETSRLAAAMDVAAYKALATLWSKGRIRVAKEAKPAIKPPAKQLQEGWIG